MVKTNKKTECGRVAKIAKVRPNEECALDVMKFGEYLTTIKNEGGYPGNTYMKLCQLWELVRNNKFVFVFVTTAGEITASIVCQLGKIVAACVPTYCLFRVR